LNELAGSRIVDVPKNQSTLRPPFGVKGKGSGQRPSLVRRVLALLIQNPELEHFAVRHNFNLEGLKFAGQELLEDVLHRIALEKPENGAILVEAYRGSPHEKTVVALAGMELNIPEGGEEAEFSGALTQLLRQSREEKLSELLVKDGREGLNDEEKQVLRTLLKERI